jgi:hypothetical protein
VRLGRTTGEGTVNRKQLLVVALVVGLLLIGWMVGQQGYEVSRAISFTWASDGSDRSSADPQPRDGSIDATVRCTGPLDHESDGIEVIRPGFALAGYAGWAPVYLEPNPCIAESAARRRTLELEAVAVLLLGIVGLFACRARSEAGSRSPSERASA